MPRSYIMRTFGTSPHASSDDVSYDTNILYQYRASRYLPIV